MVQGWSILRWGAIAMLGASVVGGVLMALDRHHAMARTRETMHLLDLLGPPPASTDAAGTSAQASVDPIANGHSDVALSIRVGLVSRTPILAIQASPTTTCRLENGSPIAVSQLLHGREESSRSSRFCRGGAMRINGLSYEGTMEFVWRNNDWFAVNEIKLEHYVASVVGAEMPSSWHGEALKAQAVAARSYAVTHLARPARSNYHLGDTTRWQVYSGTSSLSESSLRATRETQHMVLSFQGGIVESLYAANQAISEEAHRHLGASMSQEGAQHLATQGMGFDEILGRYYQGATLAHLRRDGQ